jgi:hypothetical protein
MIMKVSIPRRINSFMIMAADTGEAGEVIRVGLEG